MLVTFDILPHSPYGYKLARRAYWDGKKVILHAPMKSIHDHALGSGALTTDMTQSKFAQALAADLYALPNVEVINNHIGLETSNSHGMIPQMPID